jgi:predicted SAM-dependent methyltransferase
MRIPEPIDVWRKQRRIQAWTDRISKSYDEAMKGARERKASSEELDRIAHEHHFEHQVAEDELYKLQSGHLIRVANRLMVPVPPFKTKDGAWMESSIRGGWHLTPEAMHDLRAAIRAERKARREEWTVWVSLLALTVGVLSSLTALVAVWKN